MASARPVSVFIKALPWLALGPITGPLAWRMYHCIRAGEHALAGMYAILIVGFWVVLGTTGGQALADLAH